MATVGGSRPAPGNGRHRAFSTVFEKYASGETLFAGDFGGLSAEGAGRRYTRRIGLRPRVGRAAN